MGLPSLSVPRLPQPDPGRDGARPRVLSPAGRPLLGSGSPGRWLPGAGGPGGPGSRPQPPAGRLPDAPGRKRLVWASGREEVPFRARGGSALHGEGRAGAGAAQGRGSRPGRRPFPPPRARAATRHPHPATRPAGPLPSCGPRPQPEPSSATPSLRPRFPLCRSYRNPGLPRAARQGIQPGLDA